VKGELESQDSTETVKVSKSSRRYCSAWLELRDLGNIPRAWFPSESCIRRAPVEPVIASDHSRRVPGAACHSNLKRCKYLDQLATRRHPMSRLVLMECACNYRNPAQNTSGSLSENYLTLFIQNQPLCSKYSGHRHLTATYTTKFPR
jgi:hypothetical protein